MPKYMTPSGKRASILDWNLSLDFLNKEQMTKFIKLLLKEEIDYDFEYEVIHIDSLNPTKYRLTINNMSWASNLKRIAKLLEKVDYEMD